MKLSTVIKVLHSKLTRWNRSMGVDTEGIHFTEIVTFVLIGPIYLILTSGFVFR